MKKVYLCIIYILTSHLTIFAQSPCDQTQIYLSSQAEVDSFPARFCSTLCSLDIEGSDITNLDSLYILEKVGELRIIFNPELSDISGLSNITRIESACNTGGLVIGSNNLLSNLDALSSLTVVNGYLSISFNTMLSNISGLSNLEQVHDLEIDNNASLASLDGLQGLTRVNGDLSIGGNPGLTNIDALSHVTRVDGQMVISRNDALTTLDGAAAVTWVGGLLSITENPDLISIQGLSNINHIGQLSVSGMSLEISFNDALTSLNGLQGLDTIPGTAAIEWNESLLDLDGLSSLRTFSPSMGYSYNSGIRVANNNSLVSIAGIAGVERITNGRAAYLDIDSNPLLAGIDLPNLKSVEGSIGGRLSITGNSDIENLDGLSAFEKVTGGLSAVVEVTDNASLQNLDGLASLVTISSSQGGTLTLTNNTTLGSFCGLYSLFDNRGINCGSPECYSTVGVTIEGNERNPTPEEIQSEGPCDATASQPTNLVFSQVTSEGMRVSFNRAPTFASGYIVLMKSYGPSAPEDVPQDGQTYHVGQVIGSSSIVVHVSTDTTFVVSGLVPSTPYYFDIFSWKVTGNGNDYLIANPLEGSQTTTSQTAFVSSVSFTDVSDESMTVMVNDPQPGNYIALMKAFGSPSPNDTPVDGTEYHVGGTVGSSTIVVNIGDGSAFTVNGLMPNVSYYFDIYQYDPSTFGYRPGPSQGSHATESGENLRAYPNPFDVATTIPFVVSQDEETVQVAIYDTMGKEISVLTTGNYGAGRHEASWDGYDKNGRRVNAGIYIYSVKSESRVVTGRVSLR